MNFMEKAYSWLAKTRNKSLSVPVLYYRAGEEKPLAIRAMPTIATFRKEGKKNRGEALFHITDFAISTEYLPFLGDSVPQVGDYIEYDGRRYDLMNIAEYHYTGTSFDGECWGWGDPYHNTIRVHTQWVRI